MRVELERTEGDWAVAIREATRARAALARVEAIHQPRTGTVYSHAHHEAEHVSEDERCTDACFEPWESCNGCGSHWPCWTAAALSVAATDTEETP